MPSDDKQGLFYWVDRKDHVFGAITRVYVHADTSKIHRSVGISLHNSLQNTILFQQRSMKKDKVPGFWTIAVGGHVSYGETYLSAAKRELEEELGIRLPLQYKGKMLEEEESETECMAMYML